MPAALTILLTGTRAPATLDLARRLQRSGHRVVGADSMRFPLGRFSCAFATHHRLPPPRQAPRAFLEDLQRIVQTESVEVLWPTCEEIFHIAQHHAVLAPQVRLMCEPLAKLAPLHHKLQFTELVRALGTRVQAPASWPASEAPAGERLVWKPYFSRFAAQTRFTSPPLDPTGWLAQRCISGREFCSWAICQDGHVKVMTMYDSRVRAGRGAGCSFEPRWSEAAAEFVVALARAQQFTGVLAFDFMEQSTGEIFVLECNPRMTSGIHLLGNELDLWSLVATGNAARPAMQAAQLTLPVLLTKPWLAAAAPDVVCSLEDPGPCWTQFLCAGEFALRALRQRCSLLAATTLDIEFNG